MRPPLLSLLQPWVGFYVTGVKASGPELKRGRGNGIPKHLGAANGFVWKSSVTWGGRPSVMGRPEAGTPK